MNTSRLVRMAGIIAAGAAAAGWLLAAPGRYAAAADDEKPYELVQKGLSTVDKFGADPDMSWFRDNVKEAEGVLIVPELVKAGFVVGGSGGRAMLLVRHRESGTWSGPVFFTMGSVSWGLQIGAKVSEVIMLVMTKKGLESLYTSSVKLGGDLSVAAGPVGAGVEGATSPNLSADYLSFARSKGAFAGLSLEGAVLKVNDDWNASYYGKPVRPVDVTVARTVSSPRSARLLDAVTKVAGK